LKLAVEAGAKFTEKEKFWKEKIEEYKEMSLKGQRVIEKRASICPPPLPATLSHPDDLALIREQKEMIGQLELELKETVDRNKRVLEEEKERLVTASASLEHKLRRWIHELQTKILIQKEDRIKVILRISANHRFLFITVRCIFLL